MQKVIRWSSHAVLLMLMCFLVSACAPTMFQQPVSNFNKAAGAAKDVYFAQLERTHQSFIYKKEMSLKLGMITREKFNYKGDYYLSQKKELTDLKKSNPILDTSLKVRQAAFQALDYYGQVLLALASDEKMDALEGEVKGFAGDLQTLSKTIANQHEISDSLEILGKVSQWSAPLATAAEFLNRVIEIVGNYLRDRAIREAIITSNESIQSLLVLLQKEASMAAGRERLNYQMASGGCNNILQIADQKSTAIKYLAHQVCLDAELKLTQATSLEEAGQVLLLVAKSHRELKVMAEKGAVEKAKEKIRSFYEQVLVLKGNLTFFSAK